MRSPMSRFLPLLAALVALPLAGCSAFSPDSSEPGDAAPRPKPTVTTTPVPGGVAADFFGMHDSDPVGKSWPKVPVGSLRVWDAGVVWRQVETAPGVYDFGRLDAIVKSARDHKAQTLIVLGQTPTFHARKPKKVGSYGPGAASMPDLAAWTAYVQAVVQRYAGDDVAFQVWNEANVEGYWNGTPRQMAKLTAAARTVVDAVTPKPVLVAPAMAVRNIGQRAGLRDLYAKKVAGVPVADLVDVVSLQLYPEVDAGPERSLELLDAARGILARAGVAADKPIWDTEVNYGLQGGEVATPASTEQQQANVALTYLINAAGGIGRVYWYAWDLHAIADTDLVGADNLTPTSAGSAFASVRRWLLGSKVESCQRTGAFWQCALQTPTGTARVYWVPGGGQASVTTAFDATSAETLGQPAAAIPLGGTTLQVGALPVLVSTKASGSSAVPPRT
jgi:polysaccharide biosynthesis protein PslG